MNWGGLDCLTACSPSSACCAAQDGFPKGLKPVSSLQLEIQKHPFFESLSWTDLLQKKIPPPFNPNVVGAWCSVSPYLPDSAFEGILKCPV